MDADGHEDEPALQRHRAGLIVLRPHFDGFAAPRDSGLDIDQRFNRGTDSLDDIADALGLA